MKKAQVASLVGLISILVSACSPVGGAKSNLVNSLDRLESEENDKSSKLQNMISQSEEIKVKLIDYETTKEYVEISIRGYSDWDKLDNCYMMKADIDSLIDNCTANPIFIAFGTEDSDKLFVYGCKPEGIDEDNKIEKSLLDSEDITLKLADSRLEWNSKKVKCPATDVFKLNVIKDKNKQIIGLRAISMNGNEIHW